MSLAADVPMIFPASSARATLAMADDPSRRPRSGLEVAGTAPVVLQ